MKQRKLYVGNLDSFTTQFAVEKAFSQYAFDNVHLIEQIGMSHLIRFAFITFATQEDAMTALEMNGKTLGGRELIVNFAIEKSGISRRYYH